jgi:outer membrane protein
LKNIFFLFLSLFSLLYAKEETWYPSSASTPAQNEPLIFEKHSLKSDNSISIDDDFLIQNPVVLANILDKSLETEKWEVAQHLLDLYVSLENHDDILIEYAKARLSHAKGNYGEAIKTYQNILSSQPELMPVRLYLAQALFENKDFDAALFHFEKLHQYDIPPEITKLCDQYIKIIQKHDDLKWNGWITYLNDNNINNTSSDKSLKLGDLLLERTPESLPQQGEGIGYGVTLAKDFTVNNEHTIGTMFQVNGKTYWNNHEFDDFIGKISIGYKVQNPYSSISTSPFYQKRFFGSSSYSNTFGIRFDATNTYSQSIQTSLSWEYGKNSYIDRNYLNGWYHFTSFSTSYNLSSQTLLFLGTDMFYDHTEEPSESSFRVAGRAGLSHDFANSLSFLIQGGYAKKLYNDAPNMFGIRRNDYEYNTIVSIWNRQWYKWSIIPKLNFDFQKIHSNINVFTFEKSRYYITLEKRF